MGYFERKFVTQYFLKNPPIWWHCSYASPHTHTIFLTCSNPPYLPLSLSPNSAFSHSHDSKHKNCAFINLTTTTQHQQQHHHQQQQQHRRQHFATVRKSFRAIFFSSRYLKSGKGCEKRPATEAAWGDCKIFIPSYKTLNLSGLNWGWSRNCFLLQRFLFLSLWIRYNIVFCWQCYSQHNWSFYRHTSRRYLHRAGGCILL